MRASVIICTHSRAPMLARALGALLAVRDELREVEVLVVDNASTDETGAVCDRFTDSGLQLRCVCESVLGLSSARNRGITEARGEVLLFLDDDALVGAGWLEQMVAAFDDPGVGAAGGRVLLEYLDGRPEWLSDYAELYLTKVDWPGDARDIDMAVEWIAGANMAFRRSALRADAFSVQLGRRGSNLLSGEETQLLGELAEEGWRIRYVPGAPVRHLIPGSRVNREYLLARARAAGVSGVAAQIAEFGRPNVGKQLRAALASMATAFARYMFAGDAAVRMDAAALGYQAVGAISATICWRRYRHPSAKKGLPQ